MMYIQDLYKLEQAMRSPEMLERSVEYLALNLQKFLRPGDKLMLCFTTKEPDNIGELLRRAAKQLIKLTKFPITDCYHKIKRTQITHIFCSFRD